MRAVYPPYLNARISMLADRLLPKSRLESWIDQSVEEGEADTGMLELGIQLDELGPDAVSIEQALLSKLLEDVLIVTRPLTGPERDFLVYGLRWFELANLKVVIRGKLSGLDEREIRQQLLDISPFNTLPTEELLHTEDPAEMLRRLEDTPYADLARQARHAYDEHKDLFSVELAIDRRFFVDLQKRARAVSEDQRQAVLYMSGCTLDRFNLVWLLRYRFSYELSPAETYYHLIPAGHILSAQGYPRRLNQHHRCGKPSRAAGPQAGRAVPPGFPACHRQGFCLHPFAGDGDAPDHRRHQGQAPGIRSRPDPVRHRHG